MAEKSKIFSSKIKYDGIFSFSDFYKFCYDWLREETGLTIFAEEKYKEKLSGDAKDIDIEWMGTKEFTDYLKMEIKVKFKIIKLTNIEITRDGKKVKINKGSVEVDVKGNLIHDPKGKFERNALLKFMRGVYEKMVIPARIEEFEAKLTEECDEFLSQSKAYLDLEGKR